jgi:tRNA-splicing ligase RtcB
MNKIKVFGKAEESAIKQLEACVSVEEEARAVLCADNHKGYSQPIGGAVAYKNFISPSGVGYDIACGNKAAKTNLKAVDVDIKGMMELIWQSIEFGVGRKNQEQFDDEVFDKIANARFTPQRTLLDLARNQLGTVGSGNHYVDLFSDEDGWLWIGVHFGSRGFGHKTATGFLSIAQGGTFFEHAKEGEMDSPPVLLSLDSQEGQDYIEAMHLAGDYAYAGRNWVVKKVASILGAEIVEEIHNHHNFAWKETHFGTEYWVVRKGCTPANPGQKGFVGGSMGDISVILEGVDSFESKEGLYSTVHGAGRVMSRTQAAGKRKKVTVQRIREDGSIYDFKEWQNVAKGLIDWESVQKDLYERGIILKGAGADEAPGVYKRLPDVLAAHAGTIKILHTLQPLGVAMAGADTFDPYKD